MAACLVGSSFLIYEMTLKVKEDPVVTYLSDVPVQVVDVSEQYNERRFYQRFQTLGSLHCCHVLC